MQRATSCRACCHARTRLEAYLPRRGRCTGRPPEPEQAPALKPNAIAIDLNGDRFHSQHLLFADPRHNPHRMNPKRKPQRRSRRAGQQTEAKIVQRRKALAAARRKLAMIWKRSSVDLGPRLLGVPGGRIEAKLYWSPEHRIWASFPPLRGAGKYWNALGVDDPHSDGALEITAEVNTPVSGTARQLQGVFIRAGRRGLALVHRGRFNIGNRGFTKEQCLRAFEGETVEVCGDRVLIVARLDQPDVVGQCARWLRAVARMKDSLRPALDASRLGGRKSKLSPLPRPRPNTPQRSDPAKEQRLAHLLFRS